MRELGSLALGLAVLIAAACGPSGPQTTSGPQTPRADQTKTLVVAVRGEPASLGSKEFVESLGLGNTKRFFNANLTLSDDRGVDHPYLAETLPHLNTDTWRVFPDGRMETVYRLKDKLTWHDGTPLSAEDFVFAARVYLTPELGQARSAPQLQMQDVDGPDPRTVRISWKEPYAQAGTLGTGFQPLPRHILEARFTDLDLNAFVALPYWTREYVGLGPYRVEQWEPGAFIGGIAFDGHALGRPKIDRIRVQFIPDPNTVVANMLAEAVHVNLDFSIGFTQGVLLQREWAARQGGTVLLSPNQKRWIQVQFRPEIVSPRALLDVRVRRALAHSIDREALSAGMYEGQGRAMDSLVFPYEPWFADVERAITKYPFDPRRADQLINEVGFARGPDGTYASPSEGRFSMELRISGSDENQREIAILAEGFRRAGFETSEYAYPVALSSDGQFRATFPGLLGNSAGGSETSLRSAQIPAPPRWSGANRGGWSNPEYDRLYEAFGRALDQGERNQLMAQMMKLATDQLPVIPIQYSFSVVAHVVGLRGPLAANVPNWNAHAWEWI